MIRSDDARLSESMLMRWLIFLLWKGRVVVTAAGALCLFAAGCGKQGLIPVSGTITWNGEPLSCGPQCPGSVTFQPSSGMSGRLAVGSIDDSGEYQLTTFEPGDGIAPGEYQVHVNVMRILVAPDLSPEASLAEKIGKRERVLPDKYYNGQTSGLTATIKEADDARTIDFDLEGGR